MKKTAFIFTFLLLALFLNGCSYKVVNTESGNMDNTKIIETKIVDVSTFYNGEDGFSLSIPTGNVSTCNWTYEGGSASIPYLINTEANTATEKHIITFPAGSRDSYSNFKVVCVDDFGNQYNGSFPEINYDSIDNVNIEVSTTSNNMWNW